jgi:hypothetical protein
MLEPIGIIPFREILTGMSAAAFGASDGRMQTGACLRDHVVIRGGRTLHHQPPLRAT